MKYLALFLLCLLPIVLTAQFYEYRGSTPLYNQTVQLFSHKSAAGNLFFTNVTGDTMTYWVDISKASDLAVTVVAYDSVAAHVYYRMRNSATNARKGWTLLDSAASFTNNALNATKLTTNLQLATLLGYDRIQFYVLYKERCTKEVSKYIRVYLTALQRSGGPTFNPASGKSGVVSNSPYYIYSKTGYSASTANETTQAWVDYLGSTGDIAFLGKADDSIRAVVYYKLNNALTGATTAWTVLDTMNGADETVGQDTLIGTLAMATTLGYDQLKIYVDQIAGSTSGTVTRYLKIYTNFLRRE